MNQLVYEEKFTFSLRKKATDNVVPFNDQKQLLLYDMKTKVEALEKHFKTKEKI
jgi:hypothetical protein